MVADGDTPAPAGPRYVKVADLRPEGEETGCLRPLGMCDLGGCCDICWYGQKNTDGEAAPSDRAPAEEGACRSEVDP